MTYWLITFISGFFLFCRLGADSRLDGAFLGQFIRLRVVLSKKTREREKGAYGKSK